MTPIRLGVNVDHVATLRNARGGTHPDVFAAAEAALAAGADSITIHLREDRRHIRDGDVEQLVRGLGAPVNLEMAATAEMQRIALANQPHAVCLVPEKRAELTTEGGLDALAQEAMLTGFVAPLVEAGIEVALFLDPEAAQLDAARRIGVRAVELHTGTYADAVTPEARAQELQRLKDAAAYCVSLGLNCHAGHGLNEENTPDVTAIPEIEELNIGHYLIGAAVFDGLPAVIARMRRLMDLARRVEVPSARRSA